MKKEKLCSPTTQNSNIPRGKDGTRQGGVHTARCCATIRASPSRYPPPTPASSASAASSTRRPRCIVFLVNVCDAVTYTEHARRRPSPPWTSCTPSSARAAPCTASAAKQPPSSVGFRTKKHHKNPGASFAQHGTQKDIKKIRRFQRHPHSVKENMSAPCELAQTNTACLACAVYM